MLSPRGMGRREYRRLIITVVEQRCSGLRGSSFARTKDGCCMAIMVVVRIAAAVVTVVVDMTTILC